MSIKLKCRLCQKELEIPDSFAGKKGKCPYCGEVLDIPASGNTVENAPEGCEPAAVAAGTPPDIAGLSPADSENIPPPTQQPAQDSADLPVDDDAVGGYGQGRPDVSPGADQVSRTAASQPAAANGSRPVRLSVLLPAAVLLIGGAIAWFVLSKSVGTTDQAVGPAITIPDEDVSVDVEDPAGADDQADEPVAVRDDAPFAQTRLLAAGLPARTWLYVEIQRPAELMQRLAELPSWKDKAVAVERCRDALNELVLLAAHSYGRDEGELGGLLAKARTIHLAFDSLDGWPLVIVALDAPPSSENLFGQASDVKPDRTLTLGGVSTDIFSGREGQQLFTGYYDNCVVLGLGHDTVSGVLGRLKQEPPDSLMNDEQFVQALSVRNGDGSWLCFMPANSPDMQDGLWGRTLQAKLVTSLQMTLDPSGKTLSGVLSAAGATAKILGGQLTGEALKFAPADAAVCLGIAPETIHDLLRPAALAGADASGEAAGYVADILAALKPEAALVVPAAEGAAPVAILPVADAAKAKAAFEKIAAVSKGKAARHKEFTLITAGGAAAAFNDTFVLLSASEASVRGVIDGPASPITADQPETGVLCMFAKLRPAALAGRLEASLAELFDADAAASLSAVRDEGIVRFSADADIVGVAAAYFSDAAEKRKRENERRRAEELRRAEAASSKNVESIHNAINNYVAREIHEDMKNAMLDLSFPRSIKEVIDAGMLDEKLLQCPLDDEPEQQHDGVLSSYDFIFNHVGYRMPAEVPATADMLVVWERKPLHNGRHLAVWASRPVRLISPDELQQALADAVAEAEKHAPRKVRVPGK